MPDFIELVIEKSFKKIPGTFYNKALSDMLEKQREKGKKTLFYEVDMISHDRWDYVRDKEYPRFARYLRDKKYDPESPAGVVVSIFLNKDCYFLDGKEFIRIFRIMEDLNESAMHFRILRWLNV